MIQRMNNRTNIPRNTGPKAVFSKTKFQKALITLDSKVCLLNFWDGNFKRPVQIDPKTGKFLGYNRSIEELLLIAEKDENVPKAEIDEIKQVVIKLAEIAMAGSVQLNNKVINVTGINKSLKVSSYNSFSNCVKKFLTDMSKADKNKYYPSPDRFSSKADKSEVVTDQERGIILLSGKLYQFLIQDLIKDASELIIQESRLIAAVLNNMMDKVSSENKKTQKQILYALQKAVWETTSSDSQLYGTLTYEYLETRVLYYLKKIDPISHQKTSINDIYEKFLAITKRLQPQRSVFNAGDPIEAEIYYWTGKIMVEIGNKKMANDYFDEALKRAESSSPLYKKIKSSMQ